MADRIQMRRDTLANWAAYNPILLEGEHGYVLDDANLFKMGDGVHAWNDLPWRGYNGTVLQELQDGVTNSVPSSEAILKFFGRYIESHEFVRAYLDDEDRILWGIQRDGNVWFGAGVPNQIKDYIQYQLSTILIDLEKKVDKVDNKSLIDSEYAETISNLDSFEFIEIKLDALDKIIEGVQKDGTKVIGGNLYIIGDIESSRNLKIIGKATFAGTSYTLIQNNEWIKAVIDSQNKVLCGIKYDGLFYAQIAGVDYELFKWFKAQESIEYIAAEVDSEGKVLGGRRLDGMRFENVGLDVSGNEFEGFADKEERIEIKLDRRSKIVSYRDNEGVLHEEAGIETPKISTKSLMLPKDAVQQVQELIDASTKTLVKEKNWYLPKFGKVNIKQETFYLTADSRWATKDDVVCIQMLDDTPENAFERRTLSFYYIKSTLTPLPGGGYDRTSVDENSVRLELCTGKDVVTNNGQYFVKITKVDGHFYLTSTLEKDANGVYYPATVYGKPQSVMMNYTDDSVPEQTTLSDAYEVTPITDVPPFMAWPITKQLEHYCIADIDFGDFYQKSNVPVGIKYQGSGTTRYRKKGFRITFYKKNDYKKKNKIKIGEMVRLSGYNMKAFPEGGCMVKDPVLSNFLIEMWETRGKECYPWNIDSSITPYSGATGFIKSFPVETWFGDEFYALQFFGLKKDERNYMLDGDDDSSGILCSGANDSYEKCFDDATSADYEDEMMDFMSQETADAIDELHRYIRGFMTGTIIIDDEEVPFTHEMLEEHIDINSWIDYWIGLELFTLGDNTFHNVMLYSGRDKKKFYLFFYDLDNGISVAPDVTFLEKMEAHQVVNMDFWIKFTEEYKDNILNRYVELRNSVLTIENLTAIYKDYISGIPDEVVSNDRAKWGTNLNFNSQLENVKNRIEYLDERYFYLDING